MYKFRQIYVTIDSLIEKKVIRFAITFLFAFELVNFKMMIMCSMLVCYFITERLALVSCFETYSINHF